MKSKKYLSRHWFLTILCLLSLSNLSAQEKTDTTNKWHFLIEPYMMFPNMHGTVGLGNLPDASVDETPGDIFSNFQIGVMLYAEAYKGPWTISSDSTYMKLGSDVAGKNGILSGDATVKQLAWEWAGLYKLKPWLDAGIGLQLNGINSDLNLVVNAGGMSQRRFRGISQGWVDPSIIARVKLPLSQKLNFQFRGNIGGFGIGSDFYWQTQAYFGYRFSKLFQLSAGYRFIDINYKNGSGSDRFVYNMDTFGGVVRLGFNF